MACAPYCRRVGSLVHNVARLRVFADLIIHELWNDAPTSPVEQPGQFWQVLSLSCESFGFAEPGDIDGQSVAWDLAVGFSELVMPPKAAAMFPSDSNVPRADPSSDQT